MRNSYVRSLLKQVNQHFSSTFAPLGPSMALGLSLAPALRCTLALTNLPWHRNLALTPSLSRALIRRSFLFCGTLRSCLLKYLIAYHLSRLRDH